MESRTSRIDVRVTLRERAAIIARSRRAGVTASAYLRSRALSSSETPRIDIDAGELRHAYADLKRAGSNVNQIARALNTYGGGAVPVARIESALLTIESAADDVSRLLSVLRRS